jgi:hypothetical protein
MVEMEAAGREGGREEGGEGGRGRWRKGGREEGRKGGGEERRERQTQATPATPRHATPRPLTCLLRVPVLGTESTVERRVHDMSDPGIHARLDGVLRLLGLPLRGGFAVTLVRAVDRPDCVVSTTREHASRSSRME